MYADVVQTGSLNRFNALQTNFAVGVSTVLVSGAAAGGRTGRTCVHYRAPVKFGLVSSISDVTSAYTVVFLIIRKDTNLNLDTLQKTHYGHPKGSNLDILKGPF